MSSYEFPFNERIRTLLRLEDLFSKILLNVDAGHQHNHHSALISLLQMLDIIDRADLKMDLVQELDRQRLSMQNLRGNPVIAEAALDKILKQIGACSTTLRSESLKLGQHLRENEWLMSIKQRVNIPGGVCQFDLPSYHHWLNLDSARRKQDFDGWLSKLMPMYDAIKTILHILRGSGAASKHHADHGFFQQMLGGAKPAQMLIIQIEDDCPCFPEVSANKYAINVRFNGLDFIQRPKQCDHPIDFTMTLCNL
ncbi:MAG: cell division protein ZapD [Pseudomonadota bacterium]